MLVNLARELEMHVRRKRGIEKKCLVIVEMSHPCSDQGYKSARIRSRKNYDATHQFPKATQLWLLEVVQLAVEFVPPSLLLAGICMQFTRVLVEREAVKDGERRD